jgi:hypothetical protein
MNWNKIFDVASALGKKASDAASTDDGKKFLFGTYTDGSTRNFRDAFNDEILSPSTRKKRLSQVEKRRKDREKALNKSSKKKKNKKKKKSQKKDFWMINM